jgi:hypothetical protein
VPNQALAVQKLQDPRKAKGRLSKVTALRRLKVELTNNERPDYPSAYTLFRALIT